MCLSLPASLGNKVAVGKGQALAGDSLDCGGAMAISKEIRERLLSYQKNEITEHHIYLLLAKAVKSPENRRVLEEIADDEFRHYGVWRTYTQQDVKPDKLNIWKYYWISRIFGFTFGVKLMERGEKGAQDSYEQLRGTIQEADVIVRDEDEHEAALLELLDEERLRYMGSIVLGLNDALVELTGALAGLTLALQNTRLIALTGLITGIAAALSMAASEYLSTKSEETEKHPVRASAYTGVAYVGTVLILILPYLVLENFYICLGCTLVAAILIIGFFNYYISVAKDVPFKRRFLEMTGLSLGVAALSFFIGFVIRSFLGVDI
jgi:VIT1/CCC1 family predicted Fe2+/Mn2+ transporter